MRFYDPDLPKSLSRDLDPTALNAYARSLKEIADRYDLIEQAEYEPEYLRKEIKEIGIPASKIIMHLIYAQVHPQFEEIGSSLIGSRQGGSHSHEIAIEAWSRGSWWYVGTWVFALARDGRLFPCPHGFGEREILPLLENEKGHVLAYDLEEMPIGPIKDAMGKIVKFGWQKKAATQYDIMTRAERLEWERKRCRDWAFLCRGFAGIIERIEPKEPQSNQGKTSKSKKSSRKSGRPPGPGSLEKAEQWEEDERIANQWSEFVDQRKQEGRRPTYKFFCEHIQQSHREDEIRDAVRRHQSRDK